MHDKEFQMSRHIFEVKYSNFDLKTTPKLYPQILGEIREHLLRFVGP